MREEHSIILEDENTYTGEQREEDGCPPPTHTHTRARVPDSILIPILSRPSSLRETYN